MTDRPDLVIDGDGHVIEVDETYERIDPAYRERRPRYTQAGRGYIVRLIDGKVWGPETDIGFVGVNGNLPPPTPTWGRMLAEGRDYLTVAGWIAVFPGLAILFTVLGINFLGDGLRDLLDPRLRRQT